MSNSRYTYENLGADTSSRKLLYVSHSRYENDWSCISHAHPHAECFYIMDGRGSFLIEDTEYPIRKDDLILINPNISHIEKSSAEEPLECISLGIEGIAFAFENQMEHVIFNCQDQDQTPLFYMMTLFYEMEEKQLDYEQVCHDLLDALIIQLIRRNGLAAEVTPNVQQSLICLKIRRYLDSNYMQHITLESLAELFHLNKYYIVHAFTRQFGCSPFNYLNQVRIRISKDLLANTSYSITEIALSTGFASSSYFSQCFQKTCGMSASAYRRQCRKK